PPVPGNALFAYTTLFRSSRVSGVGNLSVSGTTTINTDQITTTGTQIYTGNVTLGLGAGSTVTLAGATVTTNGALSGGANNNNLTVTGNDVFSNATSRSTS